MTLLHGRDPAPACPPEALLPPELRGLPRDGVRMMVSYRGIGTTAHATFRELPDLLHAGDVVVVNNSATYAAALPARDGRRLPPLVAHLAPHPESAGTVLAELRTPADGRMQRFCAASRGDEFELRGGVVLTLVAPYRQVSARSSLWTGTTSLGNGIWDHLQRYGEPVRYNCGQPTLDLRFYQTVFARHPGSAEMPSAGRPFTRRTLRRLAAKGVQLAGITLHAGLSGMEADEPPIEEFYQVPARTVRALTECRKRKGRIVAVGTTVVRALESAYAEGSGVLRPTEGWSDRLVGPHAPPVVADSLLTGMHEPASSHLMLLDAYLTRSQREHCYREASRHGYLWHEFGDVHLVIGEGARTSGPNG